MRIFMILLLGLAAVTAAPKNGQKIVGGDLTTINQYPMMAALLFQAWFGFTQACGGTLINNRSILTAAHCTIGDSPNQWQTRLGSTFAHSGGTVYFSQQIINHPNYNPSTLNNDVSLIHTSVNVQFNNVVQPGSIAGPNYNLADNQAVWATGWGTITQGGPASEQLRHVQIFTINQQVCAQRYATGGATITAQMLCSGVLDVGGKDQCQGDSGGPLFHNGVVVGVCSWGFGCASPFFPGVNARVSQFSNWIVQNA